MTDKGTVEGRDLLGLGLRHLTAGRPEEAIAEFNRAISGGASLSDAFEYRARANMLRGQPASAVKDLSVALQHLGSRNGEARERLLRERERCRQVGAELVEQSASTRSASHAAKVHAEKTVSEPPQGIKGQKESFGPRLAELRALADQFKNAKQFSDASSVFRQIVELEPIDGIAWFSLGECYASAGNNEAAEAAYSEYIRICPGQEDGLNNRAVVRGLLGKDDAALQDYADAIRHNPRSECAYRNRAAKLKDLADFDGAVRDYNTAISLTPGWAYLYLDRGVCYQRLGLYTKAIIDFNQVLRLTPKCTEALFLRGVCRAESGQPTKAAKDFAMVLEANPAHEDALYERAKAYRARGADHHALADLSAILSMNPRSSRVPSLWGEIKTHLDAHGVAEDELTKLIAEDPDNVGILRLRAITRMRLGNFDEAVSDFDRVAARNQANAAERTALLALAQGSFDLLSEIWATQIQTQWHSMAGTDRLVDTMALSPGAQHGLPAARIRDELASAHACFTALDDKLLPTIRLTDPAVQSEELLAEAELLLSSTRARFAARRAGESAGISHLLRAAHQTVDWYNTLSAPYDFNAFPPPTIEALAASLRQLARAVERMPTAPDSSALLKSDAGNAAEATVEADRRASGGQTDDLESFILS